MKRLKLQELCERLIEDPSSSFNKMVPSLEDIDELSSRVKTLQLEKVCNAYIIS